jgi:hypothetical protein
VKEFLEQAKEIMELKAIQEPKQIMLAKAGPKFAKIKEALDIEPLMLVLYVGVPALIIMGTILATCIMCCRKCPKVVDKLKDLKDSIFFGVMIKTTTMTFFATLLDSELHELTFGDRNKVTIPKYGQLGFIAFFMLFSFLFMMLSISNLFKRDFTIALKTNK